MNVIRLRELKEEGLVENEDVEMPIKNWVTAVADNLHHLIPNDRDYFAIYVVWLEDAQLIDPFGILELDRNEDIDRVSADDAVFNIHPMWKPKKDFDAPYSVRKKGSVLKLNFWKSRQNIFCSWNDLTVEEGNPEQTHAPKSLVRSLGRTQPGCYLVLPGVRETVAIYSENAYTYYLANGDVKRKMDCCINYETSEQAFQFFECGHAICSSCFSQLVKKKCPNCNEDEYTENRCPRVKFRSGPCPFDLCANTEMTGVVLEPCGCHVPCQVLMAQVSSDSTQEETLKILPRCPYDACKKKITKFFKFYPCS